MVLQVKMERNLWQRFLKVIKKKISHRDVFIVLQLSRSVHLRRKWSSVENKQRKQQHYNKCKQIRYFNIINISECWWEITCSSEGKVEVHNFSLLHFSRWLCLIHGQLAMSLRRVKEVCNMVICKCQCFYLFDIQVWSVLSQVPLSVSQKFYPWRASARCQFLRLYSQLPFTKILKIIQSFIYITFWTNAPRPS